MPGADVDQVLFLFSGLFSRIWRTVAQSETALDDSNSAELLQQWSGDLQSFKAVLLHKLGAWESELSCDEQTLLSNIWQTEEDMARLSQRLRPNLEARRTEVLDILREVRLLCARATRFKLAVNRDCADFELGVCFAKPRVQAAAFACSRTAYARACNGDDSPAGRFKYK